MTASTLSLEGFQDLLDRLGGDLSSWPASERISATALLDCSPEAQSMLAAAAQLDRRLADAPKAPSGLADRIVGAALTQDGGSKN